MSDTVEHIFVAEGGYFWKKLPDIALPMQTDLFGQPLGGSRRTVAQHHGRYMGKRTNNKALEVMLRIEGRSVIYDDILGTHEIFPLTSTIILQVPKAIFDHPFIVGNCYIITPLTVKQL